MLLPRLLLLLLLLSKREGKGLCTPDGCGTSLHWGIEVFACRRITGCWRVSSNPFNVVA